MDEFGLNVYNIVEANFVFIKLIETDGSNFSANRGFQLVVFERNSNSYSDMKNRNIKCLNIKLLKR